MWLSRTELLIGKENIEKLNTAHVLVVGLGGVGAYAAEMLCRAGVGALTIIDTDKISDTNRNRQLLALVSTEGKIKTELMAQRLLDINPNIKLTIHHTFLNEENLSEILPANNSIHYVVDAIDTLAPKISLLAYCVEKNIPVVSSMGAGAKFDATKVEISDISKSHHCPLAHMLRKRLGRERGIKRGIQVVFSPEIPNEEAIELVNEQNKKSIVGTISYLPPVFGCVCAQAVIKSLIGV